MQLFGSKMDVDLIIKNPIHDHPYSQGAQSSYNAKVVTMLHGVFNGTFKA